MYKEEYLYKIVIGCNTFYVVDKHFESAIYKATDEYKRINNKTIAPRATSFENLCSIDFLV